MNPTQKEIKEGKRKERRKPVDERVSETAYRDGRPNMQSTGLEEIGEKEKT
jgi:hypothetical protein